MRLPQHVTNKTIHFVGIGGIGMSGIAEVLHSLGYAVQGSDVSQNANTKRLETMGIMVFNGHAGTNIKDADVIVVSSAVQKNNPELVAARKFQKPVLRRAEMLAELMRFKFSVAIAGTHGKTTTTSLAAAMLDAGRFDPTVINGGIINAYNTNGRLGKGDWMVVESDESDGSFVKLPATIGVITNIDPEHLDHYGDFETLKSSFHKFIENIPFYGLAVLCVDHPVVRELRSSLLDRRCVTYGFSEDADIRAFNLRMDDKGTTFDVEIKPTASALFAHETYDNVTALPRYIKNIFLPMMGDHNVQNALSTVVVGLELDMMEEDIQSAFTGFKGVKRRFTKVGESNGITIIDDYAHHPVEIKTVLKAAQQSTKGRIIAVVQPHRYSRLKDLFHDFVNCFEGASCVVTTPVFAAGEDPIDGFDSPTLAANIRETLGLSVFEICESKELAPMIHRIAEPGDLVICLGAGSITYWANELQAKLDQMPKNEISQDAKDFA